MSNNITALLTDIGLNGNARKNRKELSIDERLDVHGLGFDQILPMLAEIINDEDNSASTRLAAIRDILKMKGVLKENPTSAVVPVTIVINDPNGSNNRSINPILIPRELHLVPELQEIEG